ncbi:copper resistance CopC family protein [Candidatus Methylocalor cossyra]|uniref:CopC domain-containing protein n=1 Tax=Candidatus Methylocalor cossyra TaxID=3108543 RepID=A0ABM9NFF8_9GAMM
MRRPNASRAQFLALLLLALAVLCGLGPEARGHAVVTETSLTREPVKPHHPTTVALFFNSNVELKLSRVFLVSRGEVYQAVEITSGHRPGELLVHLPALEPGDYALKYKVFAADGHLTENAVRFHVAP